MTTIVLSPSPLPRKPAPYEEWLEHRHLSVYEKLFNVERHAAQQGEANPANKEAEQNLTSARIAGRAILSESPYALLMEQLEPESRDNIGLVFDVGELHREYFLRLFPFDFFRMSFGISVSLQFGHLPSNTRYFPHTNRVPPSTP